MPERSCSTSARSRGTGSRRCCWPAGRRTPAGSRSRSTRSAQVRPATGPTPRSGSSTSSTSPSCAGTRARSRRWSASRPRCGGVESIGGGRRACRARTGGRPALGVVASVTGPVDHVSDGERVVADRERPRAARGVTGTGCMSTALTAASSPAGTPLDAAVEALVAFGVAGEDAAAEAKGPGSFHVELYDALAALDPLRSTGAREVASCEASRARATRSRDRDAPRSRAARPSCSCG